MIRPSRAKVSFRHMLLLYSLLFLVCAGGVFCLFFVNHKTFIWNLDGLTQHSLSMVYLSRWVKSIIKSILAGHPAIPLYTWGAGQGMDILHYFSTWYCDFFYWLSIPFVRTGNVDICYNLMVVLKIYCIGLSFLLLCRHKRRPVVPSVVGALVYAFCSYVLYLGLIQPHFMQGAYFLPVLVIGLEQLMKKGDRRLFTTILCISLLNSYYFTYMNTLLLFGYFWLLVICDKPGRKIVLQSMGKVVVSYITAALVAAPILIPSALALLHSTRGSVNYTLSDMLRYSDNAWLTKLFLGMPSANPLAGHAMYISCAAIGLSSLALMIVEKKAGKIRLAAAGLFLLCLFPLSAHVFGAFSGINNRWSYAIVLFLAYTTTCALSRFTDNREKDQKDPADSTTVSIDSVFSRKSILSAGCVFLLYCGLILLNEKRFATIYSLMGAVFLLLFFLLLLCGQRLLTHLPLPVFSGVVVFTVVANLWVNGYLTYSANGRNYLQNFLAEGSASKYLAQGLSSGKIAKFSDSGKDDAFWRCDLGVVNNTVYANSSLLAGYYGTGVHHSILNQNLMNYFESTENCGIRQGCILYGLDGRIIPEYLSSSRFFVVAEGEEAYVPFGYSPASAFSSGGKDYVIYENPQVLPFGYTYASWADAADTGQLSPLQKMELSAQTAILADPESLPFEMEPFFVSDARFSSTSLPAQILPDEHITISDGRYTVSEKNSQLKISFTAVDSAEIYLRLTGIDFDAVSIDSRTDLTVTAGDIKKRLAGFGSKYTYRPGYTSIMANLGYSADRKMTECFVTFPQKGVYQIENIEILALPLKESLSGMQELAASHLEAVRLEANRIQGEITVPSPRILCLSIPFTNGWTAFVDGKKTDTFLVNDYCTGICLNTGSHEIVLRYCTPGLIPALALCAAGLFLLLVMFFMHSRKHGRPSLAAGSRSIEA